MSGGELSHAQGNDPIVFLTHVLAEIIRGGFSDAGILRLAQFATDRAPEYIRFYAKSWAADCYVIKGNYEDALATLPLPEPGRKNAALGDRVLNLRLLAQQPVRGADLLTLLGARGCRITKWGQLHLREIAEAFDGLLIDAQRSSSPSLLELWARGSYSYRYQVFTGLPFPAYAVITPQEIKMLSARQYDPDLPCYLFSKNPELGYTARKLARAAENSVRADHGKSPVRSKE